MKLGITTIQRDRAPWIKEWIALHYLVGFRKFYFFAHSCRDDSVKIITNLKKHFDIRLITLDIDGPQRKCYQFSCENFLSEVDWMAFIDGDEYLFPTVDDSMTTALTPYADKQISALGVYWKVFGSNGYIQEPSGLLIENYRRRAPDNYSNNRHIKSIVRGRQGASVNIGGDAHLFKTHLGTVDENLRPITSGWTNYEPTYDKFRINHYICQSRSYFTNNRKKNLDVDDGTVKTEAWAKAWWKEHDRNDVLDNSMEKFIKPVKKMLDSI
ncbi:MAG: Glycosyl transferase, family 2 [Candidatus Gottesmanbacteria bacterium GW2011_GWA1_43_11]|uniref:Glycosyl transferase, family 2 n=1 Tax=Candidatus Gottesmanbacteria bacterium GW2011_GWA1_43_11 TaxID=1618436 RepID=A0A0G1CDH6_9BACT|nr:MAG: Glycosyl transferase, family 2 [Candidatus Gottesmanbacteria bacterium GW2011_GWA1_43_11]